MILHVNIQFSETPFIEETILSSLCRLGSLTEDVCGFISGLFCSIGLLSVFMPVPCCLEFYNKF